MRAEKKLTSAPILNYNGRLYINNILVTTVLNAFWREPILTALMGFRFFFNQKIVYLKAELLICNLTVVLEHAQKSN